MEVSCRGISCSKPFVIHFSGLKTTRTHRQDSGLPFLTVGSNDQVERRSPSFLEQDAPEREKFLQWLHAHPWAVLIDGKPKLTTEMTVLAWEAWRARASFEKPAHYIAEVAK